VGLQGGHHLGKQLDVVHLARLGALQDLEARAGLGDPARWAKRGSFGIGGDYRSIYLKAIFGAGCRLAGDTPLLWRSCLLSNVR
jgi:hypothetical protein